MEKGFEVLEQKIRKAAEVIQQLRQEVKARDSELRRLRSGAAEERPKAAKETAAKIAPAPGLEAEVRQLREEREEIRQRITKLVGILEELDKTS